MWIPRPYQHDAIEAGLDALAAGEDALIVVPTGGGKSGIIGTIVQSLYREFGLRIVSCAHVKELVDQAYKELIGMWDWAPAGIYSAGLGRKEMSSQILYAGIQSIGKKAKLLGTVDLLMIDEVHTLPTEGDGLYRQFIADLRNINPDMRVLGLTATPFRLGHGRLDEPREKKNGVIVPALFDRVVYEVTLRYLIDEGWLAPLTTKDTGNLKVDLGGVGSVGGEYNLGQLSAAVDKPELISDICADIVAKGHDRRSWVVFTPGKLDAKHFHEELQRRGILGGVITDDTPATERDELIKKFKRYELRYLVNCTVLTTGFDHKGIDLLAVVRNTKSASLYMQIMGRGTRPLYAPGFDPNTATAEERRAAIARGPKPNCLVLDYAKNIDYHGPVDMVEPRRPGKGGGPPPMKTCPAEKGGCSERIHASIMTCPACDYVFEPPEDKPDKFTRRASAKPILSKTEPEWVPVTRRAFRRHEKFGSPPSVKVEYWGGVTLIAPEWVAFENPKAAGIAKSWWKSNGGAEPTPATVDSALERIGELRPVAEIRIEAQGKYWRVTGRKLGGDAVDEIERVDPTVFAPKTRPWDTFDLDDEIPF